MPVHPISVLSLVLSCVVLARAARPQLNKRCQAVRCLLSPNIRVFLNGTQHTPHFAFRKMASASTSRDPDVEAQRDVLQPHRAYHHIPRYFPLG